MSCINCSRCYFIAYNELLPRESEGSFEYGNYRREAEDLRAVVHHFNGMNRPVAAVLGHSKGIGS